MKAVSDVDVLFRCLAKQEDTKQGDSEEVIYDACVMSVVKHGITPAIFDAIGNPLNTDQLMLLLGHLVGGMESPNPAIREWAAKVLKDLLEIHPELRMKKGDKQ